MNTRSETPATLKAAGHAEDLEEITLLDPCVKGPWTDAILDETGLSGTKLHFFKDMLCEWQGLKAVTKLLAADSAAKEDISTDDYTYRSSFDASNMRCAQYALARVLDWKFEKFQDSKFWSELPADLVAVRKAK